MTNLLSNLLPTLRRGGKVVYVTSFSDKNAETTKQNLERYLKDIPASFIETHWYEIPQFNKNLLNYLS